MKFLAFLDWNQINVLLSQTANDWMPRSMCVLDNPIVITAQVVSDILIGLSYFFISSLLWKFASQKREFLSRYRLLFLLFGLFIALCGTTHFFSVIMFWYPFYWFDSFLKFITGLISAITAVQLFRLLPFLLALPTQVEVETVIREKIEAERKNALLQDQLKFWAGDVNHQIALLKRKREVLAESVKVPMSKEQKEDKMLKALEDIKINLNNLTLQVNNIHDSETPSKE
jgi:hypothetical protein